MKRLRTRYVAFFSVIGLLFVYTGWKIAALWGGAIGSATAAAVFALLFGSQVSYRTTRETEALAFRAFQWSASVVMGLWAAFVLLCLPFDAVRLLVAAASWVLPLRPEAALFSRWIPAAAAAAAAFIAAAGAVRALRGPVVRNVEIPIDGLPSELESLRIVQFSDLHVGPTVKRGYVRRIVDRINALKPDLIAFTGDLADGRADALKAEIRPLADLRARFGVYYVTGNHEYYWRADEWIGAVRSLGWTPLLNEGRIIEANGRRLWVAGVPDVQSHLFFPEQPSDPATARRGSDGADVSLLLAHRPDSAEPAAAAGFDAMLCGHTHAGQFFPFTLLMPLTGRPFRGLHRLGRLRYYINVGTGYWGAVNRFLVPSEITVVGFRRAAGSGRAA